MQKKFLNVNYKGTKTRINVADMEDLSEVQDAIKAKYGDSISLGAAFIQLYDNQNNLITVWAAFNALTTDYFSERGSCVDVHTTPSPSRQPSGSDLGDTGSNNKSNYKCTP
jgi:hypothetical protein